MKKLIGFRIDGSAKDRNTEYIISEIKRNYPKISHSVKSVGVYCDQVDISTGYTDKETNDKIIKQVRGFASHALLL